jgi:hypothetical protein
MKVTSSFAQRMIQTLIRTSTKTIDGHRKTSDAHLAHEKLRSLSNDSQPGMGRLA